MSPSTTTIHPKVMTTKSRVGSARLDPTQTTTADSTSPARTTNVSTIIFTLYLASLGVTR